MLAASPPDETALAIGELCASGDWACAHGDFSALRDVAHRLAAYESEPLHCDLIALADACTSDPERAGALWDRLKGRLFRSGVA